MDDRYINYKVLFLCFFLGILGVHRFYQGKYITGFLMFFTLGGAFVWWIIDLVRIGYHLHIKLLKERKAKPEAKVEDKAAGYNSIQEHKDVQAEAEIRAKAKAKALAEAKAAGYNSIQEYDDAKAKTKALANLPRATRSKNKKLEKKLTLISEKYGSNVAKAFSSNYITVGMPKSCVEDLKGFGHDAKRKTSRDGEFIKEKYGKYFKKLSNGTLSTNPSFEVEVEYERADDKNSWLVCSFRDF
jgi:hypothetical protein